VFFNCHDPDRERASAGESGEKQRFDLRSLMMSRAAIVFAPAPAE